MTKETDAMNNRILAWLPTAKRKHEELTANAETVTGTMKKTVLKQAACLKQQIAALNRELTEPTTDQFEENSRGNIEMGALG